MNKIKGKFLGFIAWVFYRLISSTWKVSVFEPPEMQDLLAQKKPLVLAHFHGDELVLISLVKRYKIATMTSTSKDGEIMNTALSLLGAKTSRGSSTRGGVSALKGLLQLCKQGHSCSFAVDGPKGPLYEVKPGVFEVARLTKAPIFCCGVAVENKELRAWNFPRSWNKTYFPKPFAKVQVFWQGPAVWVDKSLDPRDVNLAKALQNQLFAAQQQARILIADNTPQS